jgi:hypothetical protein
MDRTADLIVSAALELVKARPDLPALDVLDAAMRGHHGTEPNFEAPPGQTFSDWTDDESPFGQLLRRAFGSAVGDTQKVLDTYSQRYRLWGTVEAGPIPGSLLPEFVAAMAARDDSDTAQGEWWFFLEETAERFMAERGVQGSARAAVSQYLGTKPSA